MKPGWASLVPARQGLGQFSEAARSLEIVFAFTHTKLGQEE